MRQYNVDVFDRSMTYVFNDVVEDVTIDDDYIAAKTNTIKVSPTDAVSTGDFIRLQNEEISFFGVVSDVSPGEYETSIAFKSFMSIFDEPILFNVTDQGTDANTAHRTLEATLSYYISAYYINNEDTNQRLPIRISIDSSITQTQNWTFGYEPETDGANYCVSKLYSDIIVPALKMYGVAITVDPNFSLKLIYLTITKSSSTLQIDGNLKDVTVKTLKYNDKPMGTNKLIVYNNTDYSQKVIFYVHPDRSWGVEDTDRITPVVQDVRSVTPDSDYEDPDDGFTIAAVDTAYSSLSGLIWDNLIELEVAPGNENVNPLELDVGQTVTLWYQGGTYQSILTGRVIESQLITLLFGSERIEYSKRSKW